ncbi:MAG: hypothetical protein H6Q74_2990 [Firmicutes bacterium]|nr:hypothetical protein [Bacillota bacterium]
MSKIDPAIIIPSKSWAGPKQIWIVFFAFVMNFMGTIVSAGSTNTILPIISQQHGWNISLLLLFITLAGYCGSITSVIFGQAVLKKGAKYVNIIGLILGAITISVYGYTNLLPVFLVMILMNRVAATAYQNQSMLPLINTWFPRKKGIVFSWVTMSIILSNVVWAPYIIIPMKQYGSEITFICVGGFFLVLAVLSALFIKNSPEEMGEYPDRDTSGIEDMKASIKAMKEYKSPWTFKKLLTTGLTWHVSITWGILWMLSVVFSSQVVPRIMSIGYDMKFGILVMQVSSIVAMFGKWVFGMIDQKFGTRKATLLYSAGMCIMFVVALFQRVSPALVWVSSLGIMLCVGGITNLVPSMVGTLFGRWDFAAANRVIQPIIMFVMTSAYAYAAFFIGTGLGFDAMYASCAVIAFICLISVFVIKDKLVGATNEEVMQKTSTN